MRHWSFGPENLVVLLWAKLATKKWAVVIILLTLTHLWMAGGGVKPGDQPWGNR